MPEHDPATKPEDATFGAPSRRARPSALHWPHARVRDRAIAPALGFTLILGLIVAALAIRRWDPFALFGGVCLFIGGALQLRRPNLDGAGFRDARLFVDDGTLTIDGRRIDVARALRSETKEGAVVEIEDRKGSTVGVLCTTRDERRALLRALGTDDSAPVVFGYTPTFATHLLALTVLLGICGLYAKAFHLLPAELGWRWLWLLTFASVATSIHRRLEISRDELRLPGAVVPLREIAVAEWEPTRRGKSPAYLVVRGNTFHPIKVLVQGGMAERAAQTIERRRALSASPVARSAAGSKAKPTKPGHKSDSPAP